MTTHDSAPPRRVMIVSRSLPCHVSGGLEFHVVDQAAGLVRAGVQVHLLSTPVSVAYRNQLTELGIELHELENAQPGIYTFDYLRRIAAKIASLHGSHRFDIIHGHEFALGNPTALKNLNSISPTKLALTVHGTITTETPLHPDVFAQLSPVGKCIALARFGRRYLFAPAWHKTLDIADVLLVDSEFTRKELKRIHATVADKISLVPLSLDMTRYPPLDQAESRTALDWPEKGKGFVLLTVGRLEWQKGHELALRALASLTQLDWRYVVLGTGKDHQRLSHLAQKLDIGSRVTFMGRVSDQIKARALAGADLFIWPERTHPAFGLAGLESLVMGTPVAAARRGAIPELIDQTNGILFDDPNPIALAAAIAPALSDFALVEKLRDGLRDRTIIRVAPERMINATLAAYKMAMQKA